jgi:hypothetical protein
VRLNIRENEQIYKRLCSQIAQGFFDRHYNTKENIRCRPLEMNDFSICFEISFHGNSAQRGIYVKIPKADLYKREKKTIMPLTHEDRQFATDEYRSLEKLSRLWQSDDINVMFLKPLGFISEYNAILTQKVDARALFRILRRWDLVRRVKSGKVDDPAHNILWRIGIALSRFHQVSPKESIFSVHSSLLKMERYCLQLQAFSVDRNFLEALKSRFRTFKDFRVRTQVTNTLKGLDVRNVLSDKTGKVFMLDPGRMKKDYKQADLARFIVTCKILYWGTLAFFLGLSPMESYEKSFLHGYYGKEQRLDKVLAILTVKELVKHWCLAHVALQLKRWPETLKNALRHSYINPFYKHQITAEFANLEDEI